MRVLLLPDIHNQIRVADQILSYETWDSVVCSGDYFDSFYDSPSIAEETAVWVKDKLNDPRFTLIHGNHDTSYRWRSHYHFIQCSGFSTAKYAEISKVLTKDDWDKMVPYVRFGDLFVSHAGISKSLLMHLMNRGHFDPDLMDYTKMDSNVLDDILKEVFKKAHEKISFVAARPPEVYEVSYLRGGDSNVGGVTWCDIAEFEPIPGIYQLFGHTKIQHPAMVKTCGLGNQWYTPTATLHDSEGNLIDKYEMEQRAKIGCGICYDTNLKGYAVFDTEEKTLDIYECSFDKDLSGDGYYNRKLQYAKSVWKFKL